MEWTADPSGEWTGGGRGEGEVLVGVALCRSKWVESVADGGGSSPSGMGGG